MQLSDKVSRGERFIITYQGKEAAIFLRDAYSAFFHRFSIENDLIGIMDYSIEDGVRHRELCKNRIYAAFLQCLVSIISALEGVNFEFIFKKKAQVEPRTNSLSSITSIEPAGTVFIVR